MKINKTNLQNSQVEIKVALDATEMKQHEEAALKKLGKKAKKEELEQETTMSALDASYKKIVTDEKILPVAQPQVNVTKQSPLEFTLIIAVYPEVTLGKYKDVKVKVSQSKATKKEIEDVMKQLQDQVPSFKEVDRKAKKGDFATIDFAGFTLKGEPVPNTEGKDHKLELGAGQFIPGFEENITGLKASEEKTFEITFPKEYQAEEMAGNTYKFTITVKKVEEKATPEINEDFVEKITGKKDSVESLMKEVEMNLNMKKYQENRGKAEEELLAKLNKQIAFDIPEAMVEQEIEFLIDNIKMQGLQQGMPWEKYLEKSGKTEEEVKKEVRKDAEERVRNRIIIQQIIKAEGFLANEVEIQARADARFQQVPKDKQKDHEADYKKGGKAYIQIENIMLVEQVFSMYLGEVQRPEQLVQKEKEGCCGGGCGCSH